MSTLTFTLKKDLAQRLDVAPLTPDALAEKSVKDIAATLLWYGKRQIRADEAFDITGDDTNNIAFKNSSDKLDYIGSQMKSGSISIEGNAGNYLGFQMRNGDITLNGNALDFSASGMANGTITINGNVGDFLGGAIIGERKGMRGGLVIIKGDAGDRVGDQMRRGIILIEGNAGQYCASRMLAGTIGILGNVGEYIGFGMRRGTLLLTQTPKLHATIQDCGTHTLPFLSLMFKAFQHLPSKFAQLNKNRVQRYAGDLGNDGKGEILVFKESL
jgi:formylmethanofuran dehydrogenase subunit C